ncbi:hypothetical protein [Lacticaseibacillus zeae]|uniref:hypothetical protein n=1 Tax=Lacticaseibacillus zeae TaxID=57037 RepID=UPI001484D92C|nr:hypothetical protein [Lacticaseibacillus zeae]
MHNWLKERTPWQIGLLVVGVWLTFAVILVALVISLTPNVGSFGGPFIPSVYRDANGNATVTWLSDVWIIAIICGFLTGRQYRNQKKSPHLIQTFIPLLTLWIAVVGLAQWYPLATQTFPKSTAGILLLMMLSFLSIFPAGIISAYVGLFKKGGRMIWAVFFIFLVQMLRPNLWIVNGESHVGIAMLHTDPTRWEAWVLMILGVIVVAVFAFLSTNDDIVKREF